MIYWDHNATTPCSPEVVEAMRRYWNEEYGNPSSNHVMGRRAATAVNRSREQVSNLINCHPSEIIFTSGATESNNLLFMGVLLTSPTERNRIVVSSIEHKSVLEPARFLTEHGFEIVELSVTRDGVVKLEDAEKAITERTLLVSVQAANNELGTLQPISELADIAHTNGAYFHTDAAQILGKLPFDVQSVNCDFASFSAHKMYGPKGIGALFVRGGVRRWPWERPFRGGGQEMGLRPGTSNVPAIVGFGEACRLAINNMSENVVYLKNLSDEFICALQKSVPDVLLINELQRSLPGTLSLLFYGISADVLIANCNTINISKGSACSSGVIGASHVINKILEDESLRDSVIRISFGIHSSREDFYRFIDIVCDIRQRSMKNGQ